MKSIQRLTPRSGSSSTWLARRKRTGTAATPWTTGRRPTARESTSCTPGCSGLSPGSSSIPVRRNGWPCPPGRTGAAWAGWASRPIRWKAHRSLPG